MGRNQELERKGLHRNWLGSIDPQAWGNRGQRLFRFVGSLRLQDLEGPVTGGGESPALRMGVQFEESVPKHCREREAWGKGGTIGGHSRGLTIQALHGQHVVPAEQRVAAQPLVVGRHERTRRG